MSKSKKIGKNKSRRSRKLKRDETFDTNDIPNGGFPKISIIEKDNVVPATDTKREYESIAKNISIHDILKNKKNASPFFQF